MVDEADIQQDIEEVIIEQIRIPEREVNCICGVTYLESNKAIHESWSITHKECMRNDIGDLQTQVIRNLEKNNPDSVFLEI